jgi:hypothetical protein
LAYGAGSACPLAITVITYHRQAEEAENGDSPE